MIIITSDTNFIKIDFTYYTDLGEPFFDRIIYVMKDKILYTALKADNSCVSFNLVDGSNFFFDMDDVKAKPAQVDGVTPENNEALTLVLAQLK